MSAPGLPGTAIVVGNPKPRSRTWLAAHRVLRELTGGAPDVAVDLSDIGPQLLDWSPLMLGAHWRHGLAGEVFLKPVLAELGANTPTPALYLLEQEWDAPGVLDVWLGTARDQLGW